MIKGRKQELIVLSLESMSTEGDGAVSEQLDARSIGRFFAQAGG